jgi:hypothetical protein
MSQEQPTPIPPAETQSNSAGIPQLHPEGIMHGIDAAKSTATPPAASEGTSLTAELRKRPAQTPEERAQIRAAAMSRDPAGTGAPRSMHVAKGHSTAVVHNNPNSKYGELVSYGGKRRRNIFTDREEPQ